MQWAEAWHKDHADDREGVEPAPPAARAASTTEDEEREWRRRVRGTTAGTGTPRLEAAATPAAYQHALRTSRTTAAERWPAHEVLVQRRRKSASGPSVLSVSTSSYSSGSSKSSWSPRTVVTSAANANTAGAFLDESARNPHPSSPTATMMEVNVVPSVVLHFHGFRSSLFSSLWEATCIIAIDLAKRSMHATVMAAAAFVALLSLKLVLISTLRSLGYAWLVCATFWSLEALAVAKCSKTSALLHAAGVPHTTIDTSASTKKMTTKLPRLAPSGPSIAMLPNHPERVAVEAKQGKADLARQPAPRPAAATLLAQPQLPPIRRRILEQLRERPVTVNTVPGERRRRADVVLHEAKIRVGKAFLDPVVARDARTSGSKRKPVDIYMVRVDCARPDDKHMNPVVMWDFTATFEDFRKLERDLKQEIKAKRLRNVSVPHLWSGAILFVQPELTQDVLQARRKRLQEFVDALRADKLIADLDAMRKFCQAF